MTGHTYIQTYTASDRALPRTSSVGKGGAVCLGWVAHKVGAIFVEVETMCQGQGK